MLPEQYLLIWHHAPGVLLGSSSSIARGEGWKLPSYCSRGGMGASQLLPRRRGGSFPAAAQEEEWELPTTAQEEEWQRVCLRLLSSGRSSSGSCGSGKCKGASRPSPPRATSRRCIRTSRNEFEVAFAFAVGVFLLSRPAESRNPTSQRASQRAKPRVGDTLRTDCTTRP